MMVQIPCFPFSRGNAVLLYLETMLTVLRIPIKKLSSFFVNSFTRQNVRCKQALVASSCGKEAGDFAFYVAKLMDIRHAKRCNLNVNDEYKGS